MCVLQDKSEGLGYLCLGHQAERRLVLYVCEAWFVVQFPGVLRCPDFGCADDVLLPELLFIRPGQRVTRQRRQAVVWVAGGGRPWEEETENKNINIRFWFLQSRTIHSTTHVLIQISARVKDMLRNTYYK